MIYFRFWVKTLPLLSNVSEKFCFKKKCNQICIITYTLYYKKNTKVPLTVGIH